MARKAELGTCDELTHPDKTYKEWAKAIARVAGQSEDDISKHIAGVELMKGLLSADQFGCSNRTIRI